MRAILITLFLALSLQAAESMQALLDQVGQSGSIEAQQERERLDRFLGDRDERQRLLTQARRELAAQRARTDQLTAAIDVNEAELKLLEETLHQRSGVLGELFGVVRQHAGEFRALAEDSVITAQKGDRIDFLKRLATAKALPEADDLDRFWQLMLAQIAASGEIVRFDAPVVTPQGQTQTQPVVRLGDFGAISQGRYLLWHGPSLSLVEPSAQPPQKIRSQAAEFSRAPEAAAVAVDPSRGGILSLYELRPDLLERIGQGGLVGYLILALGTIGVVLGLLQAARLLIVDRRTRRQLKGLDRPVPDNPLGRVLMAHREAGSGSGEAVLDEAILKELPPLERGQSVLKLLAAVAPLLGLLGTVVGMIATFQAITLFGTGDPKMMAGGISQALVTTMLGLSVAVPLLFLHGWLRFRSNALLELLESQSAGLIATQAGLDRGN
jgi:biopolymer transport protein ExbB